MNPSTTGFFPSTVLTASFDVIPWQRLAATQP
jgi:hypothetical protein